MSNYKRRTKKEWRTLIAEQKESGKSVVQLSKEKQIHPNLFYKKRKENEASSFVRIPMNHIHTGCIRIKIKDIAIEVESGFREEELFKIVRTICEVMYA